MRWPNAGSAGQGGDRNEADRVEYGRAAMAEPYRWAPRREIRAVGWWRHPAARVLQWRPAAGVGPVGDQATQSALVAHQRPGAADRCRFSRFGQLRVAVRPVRLTKRPDGPRDDHRSAGMPRPHRRPAPGVDTMLRRTGGGPWRTGGFRFWRDWAAAWEKLRGRQWKRPLPVRRRAGHEPLIGNARYSQARLAAVRIN